MRIVMVRKNDKKFIQFRGDLQKKWRCCYGFMPKIYHFSQFKWKNNRTTRSTGVYNIQCMHVCVCLLLGFTEYIEVVGGWEDGREASEIGVSTSFRVEKITLVVVIVNLLLSIISYIFKNSWNHVTKSPHHSHRVCSMRSFCHCLPYACAWYISYIQAMCAFVFSTFIQ